MIKELTNQEAIFRVEDTMLYNESEKAIFEDPNYHPTEEDIRKRMTNIARKAMQFLKKLKVPNENIFGHSKLHKATRIKAVAQHYDGGF